MSAPRKPQAPKPTPAPIGGLYDKRFIYVPAVQTDLKATFDRIRQQQKKGQIL